MAKTTITVLTDDLDGSDADTSIQFAFEGVGYEIDLSAHNAEKFRSAIEPYLNAGTRTGGRRRAGGSKTPARTDKEQLSAIRTWARDNGFEVSNRGRISEEIRNAYDAAH